MLENVFSQIPIFAGLYPAQLAILEEIFELELCFDDAFIFEQGDNADFLYIVVDGEVIIYFKPDDGEMITVAVIKNGGVFGWSSAFGSDTYTSGACCTANTKLLKVRGENLKKLRVQHPETGLLILERLAAVVAERMRNTATQDQVVALLEHALTNGVRPIGG
jgi:CRP-like cAMP-binding protein